MQNFKQKAFGQNFLVNPKIIQSIVGHVVDAQKKYPADQIIEIGPGKGAITLPWIDKNQKRPLVLIEKDNIFAAEWNARKIEGLQVINEDATEVDYEKLFSGRSIGIFSNLPYSVGTRIFNTLAEYHQNIRFMVLMFQKEVAERILASPDSDTEGSLGIWIQNLWNVEKLLFVPPTAFRPAPKIDSLVILCHPKTRPAIPETQLSDFHRKLWQELLKITFSHRRKMLRSVLSSNTLWKAALQDSQVDETLRAQALSWEQWRSLFLSGLKLSPHKPTSAGSQD